MHFFSTSKSPSYSVDKTVSTVSPITLTGFGTLTQSIALEMNIWQSELLWAQPMPGFTHWNPQTLSNLTYELHSCISRVLRQWKSFLWCRSLCWDICIYMILRNSFRSLLKPFFLEPMETLFFAQTRWQQPALRWFVLGHLFGCPLSLT